MITSDAKSFKEAAVAVKKLAQKAPKAVNRAFKRTGQRLQTVAVQEVRKEYLIRAGDVKKYGNLKLTQTNDELVFKSKGQNIRLIKFKTTPTRPVKRRPKVLKAAVKRGNKKPISGAFVQNMRNSSLGVYRRTGKSRLPIEQLYGPGVPIMLNSAKIRDKLQNEMTKKLEERLTHEMDRAMKEAGFN
ncbi:phage tail protein [Paenibacillus alvei]|uniref:phage tail protein n=1 Tax=Paenibacillus alvei TaxID=44250 RepID=UPI00028917B3|nr:phage tail protein [Paenibacillus alvei]EJW16907.1 prophage minor tail protein Z [Paenibacillus alvei DSM 29]EJW19904.1 prophage minor tail protein Z [Paenibacillus alvei DSM 29]MCY9543274.1 phage tail protein [Paenibacillus alvei]MCY9708469.1 phage tail protein [Paenibacillus alvei]MCY9732192.1 phage tail protein [Paenibacillus alvei]